ncbi:MAG: CIC family chloride channel protein [Candidatus Azotimanducaceae bacterium]
MPNTTPSKYSFDNFRRSLASIDSIPQFALLGIASGIATGLIIIAFRALIDLPLQFFRSRGYQDFENLPLEYVFLLPLSGSIILAIIYKFLKPDHLRVGVNHVLERLARHQGHLPLQNLLTQFFGGAIALATGHSGGREGPAIHLGAACSSLLGQSLRLPNNSIRILVGCGAAAAISASFDTPIAGVIFSMEVIIMEYTIAGFIPVILAAVTANLITQSVYGNDPAFVVPAGVSMQNLYEIPFLILQGVIIGTIAAIFIHLVILMNKHAPAKHWRRLLLAGLCTAVIALISPEILGIGYDTVEKALTGELALTILITTLVFKIIATALTIALGVPVGVIGPTLFIGAVSGGIIGTIGAMFFPELETSTAFYVILGMGAMMGAVLQAPLAALMAVMELTHTSNIILPAMLVIIVANMTASHVFNLKSIYMIQMDMLGLEYRQNPLSMALNRASVASIMHRSFERVGRFQTREESLALMARKPHWLIVDDPEFKKPAYILPLTDLVYALADRSKDEIDLGEIPANRKDVTSILLQATLKEAHDKIEVTGVQALYVNRISAPMTDSVAGLVLKEDIESYYQT